MSAVAVTCADCGQMFGVDEGYLRDHGLPKTHAEVDGLDCSIQASPPSDNPVGDALAQLGEAVVLAARAHADSLAEQITFMNARADLLDKVNGWVVSRDEESGNALAEAAHHFIAISLTQKDPR